MRFIMTIIWAAVLSGVISYVLGSMADEPFNMVGAIALTVIFSLAVIVLGEGLLVTDEE